MMPQSTPNHYSLQGHNVTIDYSLSDISGQPLLNFKVDKFSGNAHKKEIHIIKIDKVGQLITVALHPGSSADEGDPQFSFLLPEVTLQSGHETAFDTVGVETTTSRKGPSHQRYKSVTLKGKASIVESIAAKA
jgi:hypothetical protein